MTRRASPGFTLLEVLVAIAILGLGLTAILSAQTGLFASSSYAEGVSLATGIVRCKMSELELKLNKDGYPLIDTKDEGPCCADESLPGYKCKWKIEKIELPLPPTNTDISGKLSGLMSGAGAGSLGAIASVGQSNGAVLGDSAGLGDISKLLAGQSPGLGATPTAGGLPGSGLDPSGAPAASGALGSTSFDNSGFGSQIPGTAPFGSAGNLGGGVLGGGLGQGSAPPMPGTGGIASLVMSLVYPTLKPMLEASIRKLTVTVTWQQGQKARDLEVVEFVTNPQQGGIDPNAATGLDAAMGAIGGLLGGASGANPASTGAALTK